MNKLNYKCPKCSTAECEVSEIRTTGGILSKLFDIQRKKFTTVTCRRCKYTELYQADGSMLADIFDFLT